MFKFYRFIFSTFFLTSILASTMACPSARPKPPLELIQRLEPLAPINEEVGEIRELNEKKYVHEILEAVYGRLLDLHPKQKKPMPRDAHVKMHGCVTGQFTVEPKLDAAFQKGVFSEPAKSFQAIVRFSNSSESEQKDATGDARGMAIKLLGVKGDKLLPDEKHATTQDFMLLNADRFFVRNLKEYVEVLRAIEKGPIARTAWFATHGLQRDALLGAFNQPIRNPALHTYHSATPYLLGNEAIKYLAKPCTLIPLAAQPEFKGKNALHDAMKMTLSTTEVCYSFYAERRSIPAQMPIEDATVPWPSDKVERIKLGTLHLPIQNFDTAARKQACENYSFTPWHSLPEHKPLGGVNRARYSVYELISRFRNQRNGITHQEPTQLPD